MPFLLLLTLLVLPQATSNSPLALLSGRWSGTLTYLDYKDNSSRVELKTTLTAASAPEGIRYRFSYVEPNGKIVEGEETLIASAGERVKIGSDEWTISGTPTSTRVVVERMGEDAGKRARFVRSYAVDGQELHIETAVHYEAGGSLVRNVYRLKRID